MASRFLVFFLFGVVLARSFFPSFRLWIPKRCKGVHCVDLGESFQTQTRIYYLLAKFGFDTAENEPSKLRPLSVSTADAASPRRGADPAEGRSRWRRGSRANGCAVLDVRKDGVLGDVSEL